MATYYIAGQTGSNAPAGATNTIKLAVAETAAGAFRDFATLFKYAKAVFGDTGVRPLEGATIIVNDRVAGQATTPNNGYAICNCDECGTPAEIRQWTEADGTVPGSGAIKDWYCDGWVYIQPTLTNDAGNNFVNTSALTGISALLVPVSGGTGITGVHVICDGASAEDGSSRCALSRITAPANTAAYKTAVDAAVTAGATTYDNTYYIDPGTKVLSFRVVNLAGAVVLTNSSPQAIDANDLGHLAVTMCPAADATNGVAGNALLCFQNAAPDASPMKISGGRFTNAGRSDNGLYLLSFEDPNGNLNPLIIEDCNFANGGHHNGPGITGGATAGAKVTSKIIVRRCTTGRASAAVNSAPNCISLGGNSVTGMVFEDNDYTFGPILNPRGQACSDSALASGFFSGGSNGAVKPFTDGVVRRCTFRPRSTVNAHIQNGGVTICNTAAITAGNEDVASAYAMRFEDDSIGPCSRVVMTTQSGARTDYGVGDAGATPTLKDVLGSFSITRSALNFCGGGAIPNATDSLQTVLRFNPGNNWNGSVPAVMPRTCLVSNSVVVFNNSDPNANGGSDYAVLMDLGDTGQGACMFRFKNCLIVDMSRQVRGGVNFWANYVNASGNSGFAFTNNILLNYHAKTLSGLKRQLFVNDNALANFSTRCIVSGNYYGGFTHFSDAAARDTAAEFATIDTTGVFSANVAPFSSYMKSLIRSRVGPVCGGWDPVEALRRMMDGGTVNPIRPKASGGSFGAGLAAGVLLARQGG